MFNFKFNYKFKILVFVFLTSQIKSQDSLNVLVKKQSMMYKKGQFYCNEERLYKSQVLYKFEKLNNQIVYEKVERDLNYSNKLRKQSNVFKIVAAPLSILGGFWWANSGNSTNPKEASGFEAISVSAYSLSLSSFIAGSLMKHKSKKLKRKVADLYNENL